MCSSLCLQHTVKLLDAPAVIIRKLEVVRVHPLVEWSHDGRRVIGVLKTQSMAQFVHRHEEDVIPWKTKTRHTDRFVLRKSEAFILVRRSFRREKEETELLPHLEMTQMHAAISHRISGSKIKSDESHVNTSLT